MDRRGTIAAIAAGLLGAGAALGAGACGEDRGGVEVEGGTGTGTVGTAGTAPTAPQTAPQTAPENAPETVETAP